MINNSSTHNSVHSQIGMVGMPNSNEKEVSLILGIYQLYETPIVTLISVEHSCKIQHWLIRLLLAFVSVEGYISRFKFPGLIKDHMISFTKLLVTPKGGKAKRKGENKMLEDFKCNLIYLPVCPITLHLITIV